MMSLMGKSLDSSFQKAAQGLIWIKSIEFITMLPYRTESNVKPLILLLEKGTCKTYHELEWIPFFYLWPKYNHECLPSIESIDLVSYLVYFQLTNYYTKEQFKALKILQQQDFITRLKIKLRITA